MSHYFSKSRRRFVTGLASSTALGMLGTSHAKSMPVQSLRGNQFDLSIGHLPVNYTGNNRQAVAVNGSVPAPVLRWKEGERVTLNVRNNLAAKSSIHWHGMIVPSNMDGVPGLSFAGIKPGEAFKYEFDVKQSGTYWYHSHSGFQEQQGMYGAIIIDPIGRLPYHYDREHVVLLSDWTDEDPMSIYANLKKMPHIYNTDERTFADFQRDVKRRGLSAALADRRMWNTMRMSDTDLSDVTGKTYTYLMNGVTPAQGWVGQFNRGEKVLLRFINAGAMTIFDARIPGLKMTVVAADGQAVQPVSVDEFRIAPAETYDVIVEPSAEQAYTVFCQSIDRSGFARGTLTPDQSLATQIPEMDESPVLSHMDMGMQHGDPANDDNACTAEHAAMGHCEMSGSANIFGTGKAGFGSAKAISYDNVRMGPHIDMLAEGAQYRLDDPGVGLRNNGRRVLTYADLFNLYKTPDPREPERELELHLTGNMSRYMWSINGRKASQAEPIDVRYGERLRITLVNDTMMNHPIHLHGVWSDLETGDGDYIPRKHTVIAQPGARISYLVTADNIGRWAYHCHLLYHMPSMFREVRIS